MQQKKEQEHGLERDQRRRIICHELVRKYLGVGPLQQPSTHEWSLLACLLEVETISRHPSFTMPDLGRLKIPMQCMSYARCA